MPGQCRFCCNNQQHFRSLPPQSFIFLSAILSIICWWRAFAHVIHRNVLFPWLLKKKKKEIWLNTQYLWLFLPTVTLITSTHIALAAESESHGCAKFLLGREFPTMSMKGRNRKYLENSTNYRLMGENTDGMSECLVHSRRQPYASSLQRNVPIPWSPSFPAVCSSFIK